MFLIIWSVKLATIGRYGTDLPYWDQWAKEGELFFAPWFERHEFWSNLFVPHNEHRIAPTLALNLGLVRLGGDQWDARVQCAASAALHAALAAGLVWWALRKFRPAWALAATIFITGVTAAPIAWENVLGGFQSQFYFLAIFSLLAIGGLLGSPAFSARWGIGIVCAALASVSMGSGMLVAVPVAALALLRLTRRDTSRGALPSLLVAAVIGVVGWWLRPQAPWHAAFHAHTIIQSAEYAFRCLSWPLYEQPWLAPVFWAPWLVLVARRIAAKPRAVPSSPLDEVRTATDIVIASGLWVLVQIAAVSYSRAGGGSMPSPRYGDICALGLVFNALAFGLLTTRAPRVRHGEEETSELVRMRQKRAVRKWLPAAMPMVWFTVAAVAIVVATRSSMSGPLPAKKADAIAYERNVQAFILTDDYAAFQKALPQLPFPSAEWLAKILRNPTLRRLLPASVREPVRLEPRIEKKVVSGDAPQLTHRATWTLRSAKEWRSGPVAPGSGWWKIETTGDFGLPGVTLQLESASGSRVLGGVAPTKPAGNTWRAAYVRAPTEPAVLVARITEPGRTLGFSEPVAISSLSYWTWRTAERAGWLAIAGLIGIAAFGWCVRRRAS